MEIYPAIIFANNRAGLCTNNVLDAFMDILEAICFRDLRVSVPRKSRKKNCPRKISILPSIIIPGAIEPMFV